MAELAVAVVDLDVARLGRVLDPGDVHGLLSRGDAELDGRGLGRGGRGRRGHAAADGDALDVHAEVGVHRRRLRHGRRAAERDGDVLGAAAAVELRVAEGSPHADVGVVDDVDLDERVIGSLILLLEMS